MLEMGLQATRASILMECVFHPKLLLTLTVQEERSEPSPIDGSIGKNPQEGTNLTCAKIEELRLEQQ